MRLFSLCLSFIGLSIFFSNTAASAISQDIVIRQVQASGAEGARYEFVEIENTSNTDVDITGWSIEYVSSSGLRTTKLKTFTTSLDYGRIFLPSGNSEAVVSDSVKNTLGTEIDFFKPIISATKGTIRIVNAAGEVVDIVGWGDTVGYESEPFQESLDDGVLRRIQPDSDINKVDFALIPYDQASYEYGNTAEYVDVCTNTPEMDVTPPDGMVLSGDGVCSPAVVDVCPGLTEVYETVPDGYVLQDGACVPQPDDIDDETVSDDATTEDDTATPNDSEDAEEGDVLAEDESGATVESDEDDVVGIPGITQDEDDSPLVVYLPLYITELLPNPAGSDTGEEYIEIYNSSEHVIEGKDYYIKIDEKKYSLVDTSFAAQSYTVIKSADLPFQLVNSIGKEVTLYSIDDILHSKSTVYTDAQDDIAWTYYNDVWQYMKPSPARAATENDVIIGKDTLTDEVKVVESVVQDDVEKVAKKATVKQCNSDQYRNPETNRCKKKAIPVKLTPCTSGQYRHSETNRCRNIVPASANLRACLPGQYRSPQTNRCRNITTAVARLKACKEGQVRSPLTNRCKSIVQSSSKHVPCKPGYARNPETNRCKKSENLIASTRAGTYPVQPVEDNDVQKTHNWWPLLFLIAVGSLYGVWEYRHEIKQRLRMVKNKDTV